MVGTQTGIRKVREFLRTAVTYERVSTKEQAERGGGEGFSIPAQREVNTRKAESLGARVIADFVDAGESARSANRPALQELLQFVRDNHVDYVIVHKLDRLARNRADDVEINLALKAAGVTLVSATENIDETPSGMLLHGIMSSIAEFYSQNLATEVKKGTLQKVRKGGTPGRAPVGYLNVQSGSSETGLIRSVIIDAVRGPIVKWALEAYATGEWTTRAIWKEVTARGLTSVAGPRTPSKPLGLSQITRMLHNTYYIGEVTYDGVVYEGAHEPLISRETFHKIQLIAAGNMNGERKREHNHYLKSTVYCGSCKSRLIVTHAKNRWGVIYPYFICLGRHKKITDCTQQATRIDVVEELACRFYGQVRISGGLLAEVRAFLQDEISKHELERTKRREQLQRQRLLLQDERTKLLQAHYAGAVPLDLLQVEQARIAEHLDQVQARLTGVAAVQNAVNLNLEAALKLCHNAQAAYRQANTTERRLFNQAFFNRLYITDEYDVEADLTEPFDVLLAVVRDIDHILESGVRTVSNGDTPTTRHTHREAMGVSAEPGLALSSAVSGFERTNLGGRRRDRTADFLLVREALYH